MLKELVQKLNQILAEIDSLYATIENLNNTVIEKTIKL